MLQSVLFDIDNTLLLKKPSIPELVFQQAAPSTPGLTQQAVEKAYGASELWQGRQIQKENETGVKMPDQEYLQNVFWVYQQALGLADELAKPCEASLYVGDHPFDVLCAHMAHMPALWLPVSQFMAIPEGVEPPEFTARSFPDAGKILREQIFRGEEESL